MMKLIVVLIAGSFFSGAVAKSSAEVTCPDGHYCVLQVVQCFAPPCYPLPTCVSNSTQCVPPCPQGRSCLVQSVPCVKEPCPTPNHFCMLHL
ncbi:hypothetical protein PENTCL1PPCAC_8023 [Pristionchus entomophagus]|uniref:TIL domain-containing protein n=1 Tax=Pristionchus entomophagus TaxID=358040 RepID=A0AAV5SRR1_9BILA|nr:hypothetical protein PENTCL1PPCAC_8023 [Pristionchus entomophagus]